MDFDVKHRGFFDSRITFGKSAKVTKERTAGAYELEYFPVSGGKSFVNGVCHDIHSGTVLLVRPGSVRHSILHMKAYFVHFAVQSREAEDFLSEIPIEFTAETLGQSEIRKRFEDLFEPVSKMTKDAAVIQEYRLISLLCEIKRQVSQATEGEAEISESHSDGSPNSDAVRRAANYIEENFGERLSLSEIAAEVHLSPIYFHSLFKKRLGVTPNEYLVSYRLSKAKHMLCCTDKTIAEISSECGFSSQSYFTAVFGKSEGITPKEYRKSRFSGYGL